MNFFKKLQRKTTVLDLENHADKSDVTSRRSGSSAGLKRSGGVTFTDGYHTSETKVFQEPLISNEINAESREKDDSSVNHEGIGSNDVPSGFTLANEAITSDVLNSPNLENNHNENYQLIHENLPNGNNTAKKENIPSLNAEGRRISSVSNDAGAQDRMLLYASIIKGEKSSVKKLLTANPELLEAQDNFGRTPLMYCVLSDRLDCAKLLLKMKCSLDQVDNAGRSALHLAAHKSSYKFLELLYERGGNIEMKDNDGQTPLHLTSRNRHAKCLDFLLRRLSPGMAEVTDNKNRTALHWSAAFNNEEYVKLLIKYNCNTAVSDVEGKTPLHWAANSHDPTAVATMKALLISSPSALNWQDYEGRTALHFAVAHENVAAVEYLLNFKQEKCEVNRLDNSFRTPLHWAAQLGNANIVRLLLTVGAKIAISDGHGANPLLYAALYNNSDVAMEMIKHDPNILDQADVEGRTALMWAAGKGANDVIQMLLKLGRPSTDEDGSGVADDENAIQQIKSREPIMIDINRTDNKGNTALHMASWNGCARSAELLLSCNARHDLQNNMNHTPLFGACEKGHLDVVKHLLDYNASITLRDTEDRTPLHWAALGGHAEVCDLLIKKGLDPDVRDAFQRSPLHCAAYGGFINCMNLLLENKANVDLQDQEGMSALHWAAQSGHLDASKLLFQYSVFPNLMEFTEERLTPLDHALQNNRDEVAQYLIEQGALSSETIRDIAAARIQACYRGYQVRKAFLHRKNLLMKHEMLRSKKDKDRLKRKALLSPMDQLNSEDPVPKSPNTDSQIADSLCSGDEIRCYWNEGASNASEEPSATNNEEVQTELMETKDEFLVGEMERESDVEDERSPIASSAAPQSGEEDTKSHKSSAIVDIDGQDSKLNVTANPSPTGSRCKEAQSVEIEEALVTERTQTPRPTSSTLSVKYYSSATDDNKSEIIFETAGSESKLSSDGTVTNSSTRASELVEDSDLREKRKKKKKIRQQLPSRYSGSASSERTSVSGDAREKSRKRKTRKPKDLSRLHSPGEENSFESNTEPVYVRSSSNSSVKTTQSSRTVHSQKTVSDGQKTVTRTPSISEKSQSISPPGELPAEKIQSSEDELEADSSSSFRLPSSSTLSYIDDVGSDENISVEKVSGLAYNAAECVLDVPLHSSISQSPPSTSNHHNSDLPLYEYIESLMALSLSERKVLAVLQRNRKLAFKRASLAATVIQRSWRRFLNKKYPERLATQPRKSEAHITSVLPVQAISPQPAQALAGCEKSRDGVPSEKPSSNASDRKEIRKNVPERVGTAAAVRSSSKSRSPKKKEQRPLVTSHDDDYSQRLRDYKFSSTKSKAGNNCSASISSEVKSETGSKKRRPRPKTHCGQRRHSTFLSTKEEERINKKVKALFKIYGQTSSLHGLYNPDKNSSSPRNHFKTVASPSIRPKTSRVVVPVRYEEFDFVNPFFQEPVTAMESYFNPEWKSSSAKKRYSSLDNSSLKCQSKVTMSSTKRKKSFKFNKQTSESTVSYHPLEWQKIYGNVKAPGFSKAARRNSTAATRFSYNMRSANF